MKEPQIDFQLWDIEAGKWYFYGCNSDRPGKKSAFHWVPVSERAKIWFSVATFENANKDIIQILQRTFCIKGLLISFVRESALKFTLASRTKDIDNLVSVLKGLEKMFLDGYKHGCFAGIMHDNPSPMDFWRFIDFSINEFNDDRYLKAFCKAMEDTFDSMLHRAIREESECVAIE